MLYRTGSMTPVFSLRREIDRLFDDTFSRDGQGGNWAPAVDVYESNQDLRFEAELPGMQSSDVEVTAEQGVLTIRGEKRSQRKEGVEGRWHFSERGFGTFVRSFQLPQGLDEDGIRASFEDGVLTVRVPKAARPQPRRIRIEGADTGPQVSGTPRERVAARSGNGGTRGADRSGEAGASRAGTTEEAPAAAR